MKIIDHPRLYRLLTSLGAAGDGELSEVEHEIWSMFGQDATVLITDMSSFSKITKELGIVYYLALIKRMQDIVDMLITRHNGKLIKFLADNTFAIFETPDDALECIEQINKSIRIENQRTPSIWDIELACGIDCGRILNINNADLFGDAVNIAAKMGEDSAEPWEVMISWRAFDRLSSKNREGWKRDSLQISGIDIDVARKTF